MTIDEPPHPTHDLVIVGGGPRAISLIERLTARRPRQLRIAVIDRFEVGAGATWRTDQTPHFLNNTYAAHTTIYPDESTPLTGPLTPGPDLTDWARAVTHGQPQPAAEAAAGWQAPARPAWAIEEARDLQPWSFPSRRLQGVYYREQLQAILARGGVRLEAVLGTATDVESHGDQRTVRLADGREFTAPLVVLAQGMVQARADARTERFAAAAATHSLTYIPPGMPSERDWSILPGGAPVLTAGLGANFFDVITLLTEGRGGKFTARSGPFDLAYEPSGREPRFVVGSRRGLPYRSKSYYGNFPPRYVPQLATPEWFEAAGARKNQDFARDLWPQFLREFTVAHLATLAASRPALVPGIAAGNDSEWADPATVPLRPEVLTRIERTAPEELAGLVEEYLAATGPGDRRNFTFDPQRLDRPDWDGADGFETWEQWVRRWVAAERASITEPLRSPRATVNRAMALLRGQLARIVRAGAVDAASELRDIDGWFAGISLALASGPPPERTARLLALVEAGIVDLLGENSAFDVDGAALVGRSPARGEVHARAFIETRMSKGAVDVTDDPLINALKSAGAARLHAKTSAAGEPVLTRTLDVTPGEFALIAADGESDPRVRVLGIPASDVQPGSAIGATPGIPSPLLAGADLVAGQVLALLPDQALAPVG